MARYIDAEAVDFSPLKDDFERARAKVIIMGQPTADVVKVVRCKDCKHKVLTKGNRVMCSKNAKKMECVADWYGLTATDDNNFCSYGEKRSEEE